MRCEQNEKHSQNGNLLQELVEILRIKMSMAIKLRMLCYLRTQGMCVYQPKLRLRPGVRQRGNTARAHYPRPIRLRCYRSP